MTPKLYLYALAVWPGLAVVAILNGALRNYTYVRLVGEQAAHIISSLTLIGLLFLITYAFLRLVRRGYALVDLIVVGAIWFVLTVAFEFVFGHYVAGHSWERLLADYNIIKGRVWALVLLAVFLGPLIMGRLAKLRK
jgi:hypothetical protein